MNEILIDSKPSNFHMKHNRILWFLFLIWIFLNRAAKGLRNIIGWTLKGLQMLRTLIKFLRLPKELDQLSKASPPLARAIKDAYLNSASTEERKWIDKIENLRGDLANYQIEVVIMDYGAGSPNLALSEQAMEQGRTVTMKVGDVCETASKPPVWCLLLFKIVSEFKPRVCLELGTCLGISSAYQAAALKLAGSNTLTTLEGAESLASIARTNFKSLGLDVNVVVGRFKDTLSKQLNEPIDYAFIDGHHDEKATVAYFEQICNSTSRAVLVFDDISWSEGMKRAWATISRDPRVRVSVDLNNMGVCIVEPGKKEHFQIRLG